MLYFEILAPTRPSMNRPTVAPGIYADDVNVRAGEMVHGVIAYSANRIWREQDGTVTYLKHRCGGSIGWEVDMKEFLWIKMQAQTLQ